LYHQIIYFFNSCIKSEILLHFRWLNKKEFIVEDCIFLLWRTIFTNLVSITQVDLALIKWVVLEITAIYTINILLSKKRFVEEIEEEINMIWQVKKLLE
jgi:hypothetical protein